MCVCVCVCVCTPAPPPLLGTPWLMGVVGATPLFGDPLADRGGARGPFVGAPDGQISVDRLFLRFLLVINLYLLFSLFRLVIYLYKWDPTPLRDCRNHNHSGLYLFISWLVLFVYISYVDIPMCYI